MPEFMGSMLDPNVFDSMFDSDPLLAIWNAGSGNGTLDDLSGLVKSISTAVTNYVRQHDSTYQSEPARGQVRYNTVCINLRWPWVANSSAVVILTLPFFVWVVL